MEVISRLGVGPMSRQIIEAVFSYAQERGVPLMLIASKNQVDYERGYVFHTGEYREYLDGMRAKYPAAKVYVCRDHCGPGHNSIFDLADTYRTIEADLEGSFDLIHVDFCFLRGSYEDILSESKKAVEYIQRKSPRTLIEVGTDENNGVGVEDVLRAEEQMGYFTSFCQPHFFVSQTGSLIREIGQEGMFHSDHVSKLRFLADKYGVGLKEHNADYLSAGEIKRRRGLVDAVNVAPQLGVLQTRLSLYKAMLYGVDPREFLDVAYRSRKWEKWLSRSDANDKFLCSIIAGHYNFTTDAYRRLHEGLMACEDFDQTVRQEMGRVFDLYISNLDKLSVKQEQRAQAAHV